MGRACGQGQGSAVFRPSPSLVRCDGPNRTSAFVFGWFRWVWFWEFGPPRQRQRNTLCFRIPATLFARKGWQKWRW